MNRDYKLFINDILNAINAIFKFISDMNFDEFVKDDKTSSAVIRKLEVIGEATKNLPEEIKSKYLDVPWKSIAGMRDRLIHAYFGVDLKIVWDTVQLYLRDLHNALEEVLDTYFT